MEASSTKRGVRWTYAEYARLPDAGSTRQEIIADELVMTPAPGFRHQRIIGDLVTVLNDHVRRHGLGQVLPAPFDVLFADGDFFQPDILFVRAARMDLFSDRGAEAAPDLVVEVLSPSTRHRDRGIKLERYRMYGVPEYWIVDPDENRLEVWHLQKGAEAPESHNVEGGFSWRPGADVPALVMDLADLFRP